MDYNHIKDYLDKFRNILFLKEERIRTISLSIKQHTKIDVEDRLIKISGNLIQIKTSPLVKGEVLMHKDAILKDIFLVSGFEYKDIR